MLQVRLHIGIFVRVDLLMQGADMRLLVRTHQEQNQRQQYTYLDSYRQVEDHGQEERDEQHPQVAVRMFDQSHDGFPAGHRISNHDQYRCQAGHRNHAHQLP